jgi:hypothetical protein
MSEFLIAFFCQLNLVVNGRTPRVADRVLRPLNGVFDARKERALGQVLRELNEIFKATNFVAATLLLHKGDFYRLISMGSVWRFR